MVSQKFKDYSKPRAVLFFDFDGVLVSEQIEITNTLKAHKIRKHEKTAKGSYRSHDPRLELDESPEQPLHPEKIREIHRQSQKHRIPCFIITSRAESDLVNIINTLKCCIDSFEEKNSAYGFCGAHIICLGVKHKNALISLKKSKAESIEEIYHSRYSTLDKRCILFIDNNREHCELVRQASYEVIEAHDEHAHFDTILEFIHNVIEKSYQHYNENNAFAMYPASFQNRNERNNVKQHHINPTSPMR